MRIFGERRKGCLVKHRYPGIWDECRAGAGCHFGEHGVEVGLEPGTLTFGNGDEADVRFADMTLQPLHGELKLEAGRIEVRSTGGEIASSSGLALAGDDTAWQEIAQLDVLIVGTTRFALGAPNAKWARLLADESR